MIDTNSEVLAESLRCAQMDEFAGSALTGLLSNPIFYEWVQQEGAKPGRGGMQGIAADCAYAFAEAMMERRLKFRRDAAGA